MHPVTAIEFSIQKRERVTVKIYDILGCEVAVLMDEIKEPGKYKTYFNGQPLASGMYICRLQCGNNAISKKLMLIK